MKISVLLTNISQDEKEEGLKAEGERNPPPFLFIANVSKYSKNLSNFNRDSGFSEGSPAFSTPFCALFFYGRSVHLTPRTTFAQKFQFLNVIVNELEFPAPDAFSLSCFSSGFSEVLILTPIVLGSSLIPVLFQTMATAFEVVETIVRK